MSAFFVPPSCRHHLSCPADVSCHLSSIQESLPYNLDNFQYDFSDDQLNSAQSNDDQCAEHVNSNATNRNCQMCTNFNCGNDCTIVSNSSCDFMRPPRHTTNHNSNSHLNQAMVSVHRYPPLAPQQLNAIPSFSAFTHANPATNLDHTHYTGNVNTDGMPQQPQPQPQPQQSWSFTQHNNKNANTCNSVAAACSSPSSYCQWPCCQPPQQQQQQSPQQQQTCRPSFAVNQNQRENQSLLHTQNAFAQEQGHANNEKILCYPHQQHVQVRPTESGEAVDNVEMASTISRSLSLPANANDLQQQHAYRPSFAVNQNQRENQSLIDMQNAFKTKSNEQKHVNNEKMHSNQRQQQVQQTETDEGSEHLQMALTISRLLSIAMGCSSIDREQILSKLPSGHISDLLNKAMLTHSAGSSIQHEIKSVLNKLQNLSGAQGYNVNANDSQQTNTQLGHIGNSMRSDHSKQQKKCARSPASSAPKETNKYSTYNAELTSFQCTECGKLYKHLCNLRSHSKIHTDNAYVCEYCDKKFGRKANYIEHKRIHTGEKPFECPICKKRFRQKYGQTEHTTMCAIRS